MSLALSLWLLFQASPAAASSPPQSPWSAVQFMVGEWTGESEGQPGKGTVKRTYRFVLGDKFLHERNLSAPTEEREGRDPRAFFSHDRARKTLVLRQLHQEGFVNQYVMVPGTPAGTVVFETEALENVPS